LSLLQPRVDLLNETTHSGDLLVGGAQAQLLLVFDALPEMKHRLQRKMKGHVSNSDKPSIEPRIFTDRT
jgi:hypothetical protein